MVKRNEIWEEGLKENLEMKESRVTEVYQRFKTSKSRKKRIELMKLCKETLVEGIANPKASKESLEQEAFVEIRNNLKKMTKDGRLPTLKTTSRKMTPASSRRNAPTKKTSLGRNSPLISNVARKLGTSVVTRTKQAAELLQRTHLPLAQTEASKTSNKPVMISSNAGAKPPDSTPVNRAGPPMGGEEGDRGNGSGRPSGQSEERISSRVANQLRGLREYDQKPTHQ